MNKISIGSSVNDTQGYTPFYAKDFDDLVRAAQTQLDASLQDSGGVLFRVNAGDLFEKYLNQFNSPADSQYHNCNCCHSFLRHYGSLVIIGEAGNIKSALWNEALLPKGHSYLSVVHAMRRAVEKSRVLDQFLWSEDVWGIQEAGGFTHMYSVPDPTHSWNRRDMSAGQAMAERRENRRHLAKALGVMDAKALQRASGMLRAGSLERGEKLVEWAEWLIALQDTAHSKEGRAKSDFLNRVLWDAVSTAPAGWCTPRASVLGALVEDIENHMTVSEITRRHNERVKPTKYQRPTTLREGNVRQAERLIEDMGLASALRRRPALVHEVVKLWTPKMVKAAEAEGVFGHLLANRPAPAVTLARTPITMTFAKFRRTIMPFATGMKVLVPSQGNFSAFTTQVNYDAAPILQWDSDECRNPFAWYVYHNGSPASVWNLRAGQLVDVSVVSLMPCQWGNEDGRWAELGNRALFALAGAEDSRNTSLALFPECLRTELHKVRSTIEAHSRTNKLDDVNGPRASGLLVGDGCGATIVVTTANGVASYIIDRWE